MNVDRQVVGPLPTAPSPIGGKVPEAAERLERFKEPIFPGRMLAGPGESRGSRVVHLGPPLPLALLGRSPPGQGTPACARGPALTGPRSPTHFGIPSGRCPNPFGASVDLLPGLGGLAGCVGVRIDPPPRGP